MSEEKPKHSPIHESVIMRLKTPRDIHNYLLTKIVGIARLMQIHVDAKSNEHERFDEIRTSISEKIKTSPALFDANAPHGQIMKHKENVRTHNLAVLDSVLDEFGYEDAEHALGESYSQLSTAIDRVEEEIESLYRYLANYLLNSSCCPTEDKEFRTHSDLQLLIDLLKLLTQDREPNNTKEEILVAAIQECNDFHVIPTLQTILEILLNPEL